MKRTKSGVNKNFFNKIIFTKYHQHFKDVNELNQYPMKTANLFIVLRTSY